MLRAKSATFWGSLVVVAGLAIALTVGNGFAKQVQPKLQPRPRIPPAIAPEKINAETPAKVRFFEGLDGEMVLNCDQMVGKSGGMDLADVSVVAIDNQIQGMDTRGVVGARFKPVAGKATYLVDFDVNTRFFGERPQPYVFRAVAYLKQPVGADVTSIEHKMLKNAEHITMTVATTSDTWILAAIQPISGGRGFWEVRSISIKRLK